MGKQIIKGFREVPKKSRHIRWNWRRSLENFESVRYYIIVVDDKNREGVLDSVIEQIQKISSIMDVVDIEGNVKGSGLRYLFRRFETPVAPREIDWTKTGKVVIRDRNLYERKRGSLEDYVASLYS
ncbi:MAG: hypothetical protein AABX84_01065 [Nanoarchaeota archaeon]